MLVWLIDMTVYPEKYSSRVWLIANALCGLQVPLFSSDDDHSQIALLIPLSLIARPPALQLKGAQATCFEALLIRQARIQ